jgi:hypothetical protein
MIPLGVSIQYDGLLSYYDHGSAPSYHDPREMVPLTGSAKIWTHLSWSDLRALTGPLGLRLDLRFPAVSASFRLEGKAHVTAQRLGLARAQVEVQQAERKKTYQRARRALPSGNWIASPQDVSTMQSCVMHEM